MTEELKLETTLAKRTTMTAGKLGKGTPGSRTKNRWDTAGKPGSLKEFARSSAKLLHSELIAADAKEWLASKRPGGSDTYRKLRKETRSKRQAMKWANKGTTMSSAPAKEKKSSSGRGSGR